MKLKDPLSHTHTKIEKNKRNNWTTKIIHICSYVAIEWLSLKITTENVTP